MGTPNCASPHDGLAPKMLSAIFRVYTFFLGFLYPAYASYKAIESEATDDDTQWLTYWVVYSMLMIFESFADYSVFWIPGYRFAKCGFIFPRVAPVQGRDHAVREGVQGRAQGGGAHHRHRRGLARQGRHQHRARRALQARHVDKLQKFGSEAFEKTM